PGKIEADERRHVTRFERSNQHGCLALAPFDDFAQITISEPAAVSSDPLCVTINLLLNVLDVCGGEIVVPAGHRQADAARVRTDKLRLLIGSHLLVSLAGSLCLRVTAL